MSYLFIAYSVVWLGVLWYVFVLNKESRRLRERIESLEALKRRQEGSAH